MSITEKQYRSAQIAGGDARRAGRPITACPHYGDDSDGATLREAWRDAWTDEDKERRQ